MSLYERYELLDLNRDDGVKTFEAREIATGRPVKVHLFVRPSAPLQAALLKAIDHLSEEDLQRIVERGKHEGTPVRRHGPSGRLSGTQRMGAGRQPQE